MKKKLMLLAVLVALFNIGNAQYVYKPLTCSGDVPKDFLTDFSSFENIDFENIDKSSAVFLNKVLRSGKVLFGDEVSLYVSKVLDELMKNDQDLRKEIRVYLLKEADFNAFTTFNGIIFINLGLIAQLETEAQLASILAHEVTHYQQKHSVAYGKKKKVLDIQNGSISEEKNYKLYSFSKLQELEADRLGYVNYLLKSDYNTSAAFEAIELMIYSHLPFDEVPISLDYLKFSNITFPQEYNLDEVTEIESIDEIIDSLSTHPGSVTRRKELLKIAPKQHKGKDFIVSKEDFIRLRTICRMESLRQMQIDSDYPQALYQAYLLSKDDPKNPYIERSIAYSLYGAAINKNSYEIGRKTYKINKIQGESSRVFHFINQISALDLNYLAFGWAYNYSKKHPEDSLMANVWKDALWELSRHHVVKLEDFQAFDTLQVVDTTTLNLTNLTQKVKRIKQSKKSFDPSSTYFDFTSIINDTVFLKRINYLDTSYNTYLLTLPFAKSTKQHITLEEKRNPYSTYSNNLSQYKTPDRSNNYKGTKKAYVLPFEFFNSNSANISFKKIIKKTELANQTLDLLTDATDITLYKLGTQLENSANQTRDFNKYIQINEMLNERFNHQNVGVICYSQEHYYDTTNVIKSDYVMAHAYFNHELSYKTENGCGCFGPAGFLILGYVIPAALFITPIVPWKIISHEFLVFNMRTGYIEEYQQTRIASNKLNSNTLARFINADLKTLTKKNK